MSTVATLEATYTPITGAEGNKLIKLAINKKVDLMYLLKQGNSFHRFRVIGAIKVEAFPKDVPVPEIDFDFVIETKKATNGDFDKDFIKIDQLKAKRDKLKIALEKIEATLATVAPVEKIDIELNANNKPDELRIEHNLPVPMIQRKGGSVNEVLVPAKDVKVVA